MTDKMNRNLERANEEYEEYRSFPIEDRYLIALLLDFGLKLPEDPHAVSASFSKWSRTPIPLKMDQMIILSLSERAALYRKSFCTEANDPVFNFGANAIGPMVDLGTQWHSFDLLTEPNAFRFLMERLFGGRARPFIASAFAACAMHPSLGLDYDIVELRLAQATQLQTDGHESDCIFFPSPSNWT